MNKLMLFSSQARSQARAVAAGLHHIHSNARSELCLELFHSSWQCRILNPLSEAGNRTWVLMDTRQIFFLLQHKGNSLFNLRGYCSHILPVTCSCKTKNTFDFILESVSNVSVELGKSCSKVKFSFWVFFNGHILSIWKFPG